MQWVESVAAHALYIYLKPPHLRRSRRCEVSERDFFLRTIMPAKPAPVKKGVKVAKKEAPPPAPEPAPEPAPAPPAEAPPAEAPPAEAPPAEAPPAEAPPAEAPPAEVPKDGTVQGPETQNPKASSVLFPHTIFFCLKTKILNVKSDIVSLC